MHEQGASYARSSICVNGGHVHLPLIQMDTHTHTHLPTACASGGACASRPLLPWPSSERLKIIGFGPGVGEPCSKTQNEILQITEYKALVH